MISIKQVNLSTGVPGLFGLGLVYISGSVMNYYVSKGFFDTISKSLDEAAMIDGANKNTIFWRVIMPLSKPIIVYTILLAFTAPWGDYMFASVIAAGHSDLFNVAVGLQQLLTLEAGTSGFPIFCAAGVIVSIPIMTLFFLLQNYYVEFEKYFQRITKRTGNDYKKWLQQRKGIKEKIEVMFFGHSLDATDSDIIRELVCNDNSFVKIYYYNDHAHQQIVANLIEIIGKDNLINLVSGLNPRIQFIKQRKHRMDNTAGIEITRDIRTLYTLHTLSNNTIDAILDKLKEKIKIKDIGGKKHERQQKICRIFILKGKLFLFSKH